MLFRLDAVAHRKWILMVVAYAHVIVGLVLHGAQIAWLVEKISEALHWRNTNVLTVDIVVVSLAIGEKWPHDCTTL